MNTTARLYPLLTVLCLASHALAGEDARTTVPAPGTRQSVKLEFQYDRRELQSPEGALRIHRRLQRAAQRACTDPDTPRVQQRRADEQCVADLVEQVLARIGSAQLASVHGAVTRKPNAASR